VFATSPAPARAPIDAERKRRLQAARRKTSAFGQVVAVMARSNPHKQLPLAELTWLVAPAVQSGQFMMAGKRFKKNGMVVPVTALLWARVSDDVDQQLARTTTPMRLDPKAWTSGDHIWLIDAVGDQAMVPQMIQRLGTAAWKGKTIKIRTRQADGSFSVHAIGPL
jgi:hemolysin-activating ACP:hemolysin acyltransferase